MNVSDAPSIAAANTPIADAIRAAANATGINFDFLFTQAKVESGLNSSAHASTSSAAGLFQFTHDTWLKMIQQHGDDVGLGSQAALLRQGTASRSDISAMLELRNNPQVSAQMAAQYAVDNARALQAQGHTVSGPTDLYIAHFLGSSGAARFLDGLKSSPNAPAADVLPAAASANRAIFYKDGAPRSFSSIYNQFAQRFETASAPSERSITLAKAVLAQTPQSFSSLQASASAMPSNVTQPAILQRPTQQQAAWLAAMDNRDPGSSASAPAPLPDSQIAGLSRHPWASTSQTGVTFASPIAPAALSTTNAPVAVDSLAKFLDTASQWLPDAGALNEQASKGAISRSATDGLHSSQTS
jgi:hypothetical protein